MATMTSHNNRTFASLDGLRGVAAIVVLIAHIASNMLDDAIFGRNYMAVQFFFMLSGFVMMCAYEKKLRSGFGFIQFYLRRVIRLFPLIWVGTLLGWMYFSSYVQGFNADPARLRAVAFTALGVPFPNVEFSPRPFPLNPPEWSLFYELMAYACFGLFVRFASSRALLVLAGAALAIYTGGKCYYGYEHVPFWFNTVGVCVSFTIGMLLWRAHERRLIRDWSLPFPVLATVMVLVCALRSWWPAIIDTVLVALVFPGMILLGANRSSSSRAPTMLNFLGELSYPLYILHWPIMLFTRHFLLAAMGPAWTMVAACLFSLAISWTVYILVDHPVRRYLNQKLFSTRKQFVTQPL